MSNFDNDEKVFNIVLKNPFARQYDAILKILLPLNLPASAYLIYYLVNVLPSGHSSFFMVKTAWFSFVLLLSYFAVFYLQLKRQFVLSQDKLSLPAVYCLASGGRLTWHWKDLKRVVFSASQELIEIPDQLVLVFKEPSDEKEKNIYIDLRDLDHNDLKKLIYSITNSAPKAEFSPPIDQVAIKYPTASGLKQINFNDFTSLWDQEFSARFSPTLYVPLAAGSKLRNDSITIVELLACGGSAAIYAATDLLGEQIIVKEAVIPINSPTELREKALELFNREALLLSKLDHPKIAKVLDHFVENDHHFEVIEYIDGLDLRRFVKERGPQRAEFVLNWAEQIAEILDYLHTQEPPIIHRDLTPDNLVLKVDGRLVLIDFGAANAFVGTATGTMVGKQSYMPPEQIRGKAVPQSDIYALGGTCYFLLTGNDPTPLETAEVPEQNELAAILNPFLARCTALNLEDRYQSAKDALQTLRHLRLNLRSEASREP
ncbi:MAG: serine/threonine protein kinase [Candidatus Obscuribacterales bacterium]|nr:serine/threonine protein kinase [Candidatus Obscuribacterales bacterium]